MRIRSLCAVVVVAGALLAGAASPADAAGSFGATVTNTADTAASGTLAFTHTYAGGTCTSDQSSITATNNTNISCAKNMYPASDANQSSTDSIKNDGSIPVSQLTAKVGVSSCGPVQLANNVATGNPMLPRYAATLNGNGGTTGLTAADSHPLAGGGSVTFNGTTDYASSVVTTGLPILTILSNASIGLWFKTTDTNGAGLLSWDTSAVAPSAPTGSNLFVLSTNAAGKLSFTLGGGVATGNSATAYNDGKWHYAYITINTALGALGANLMTVNLYVDGGTTAVATASGLVIIGTASGYWIAGWSQANGYLAGSESSMVVANNALANGSTLYSAGTQALYDSRAAASGATQEWHDDDPGTTTYAGPYPVIGASSPCSMVNASWNSSTATPLSTLATTPIAVTAPAPGTTQANTLTLTRGSTFNASYVPGLQLFAPVTYTVSAGSGGQWSTRFAWDAANSTFVA